MRQRESESTLAYQGAVQLCSGRQAAGAVQQRHRPSLWMSLSLLCVSLCPFCAQVKRCGRTVSKQQRSQAPRRQCPSQGLQQGFQRSCMKRPLLAAC